MALLICLDCTTAYSVGAPACPHCGSAQHAEQGAEMAGEHVAAAKSKPAKRAAAGGGQGGADSEGPGNAS